jgi:uncharacterized protein
MTIVPESKLLVRESLIPGSGKGLFTTVDIKKGTPVIQYTGEMLTWNQVQRKYKGDILEALYLFHLGPNKWIDAQDLPKAKARYANDAKGFVKVKSLNNNSEYQIIDGKAFIVATRDIKAGEEIFVDYTQGYWKALKEKYKLNKK